MTATPISQAYHMTVDWEDEPQQPCFWTGWHTICPRLLSPDAVVRPLLHHRRLLSPTPSMSSDDDPAQPAESVVATQKSSAEHTPTAPVPIPGAPSQSRPSSGDTETKSIENGEVKKDFWQPSSTLTTEPVSTESAGSNGSFVPPRPSRWKMARSTSTESALSLSGITTLGSMYNQDGFPNYPVSTDEDRDVNQIAMDDAAIAKQLALTDEAVRAINGTPGVVQAGTLGMPMASANSYELPRSMAAFVRRPGATDRDLRTGRSFVSSGSSTSSEESEHLASVQWVKTAVSSTAPTTSYSYYPYYGGNGQQNRPTPSPTMPPPPTLNVQPNAPRRNGAPFSAGGQPSSQASSISRPPPSNNSQPAGASAEGSPVYNEDDEQTIGGIREGSPLSSSNTALDILVEVASQQHDRTRYSSSTRRKAGAEAVAQWRESGIPTGDATAGSPRIGDLGTTGYDTPGYESTPGVESRPVGVSDERPKKRRKSNMQMDAPDPSLRQASSEASEGPGSDFNSDNASGSDSEYHSKGGRKRTGGAKSKKPRVRNTLLVPPPVQAVAKGGQPTPKKTPKARQMSESAESMKLNGVQCEYVNPLPPYQRCPDVFTRKYDIPRHMARHARREGDLVTEGKLPEEKAILWKTIRDKPRIRCNTCGEYFTR